MAMKRRKELNQIEIDFEVGKTEIQNITKRKAEVMEAFGGGALCDGMSIDNIDGNANFVCL